MKAIIYARVSTSHHDQNPEVQLSELRRHCQSREWIVAHELVDHGYTGSSDNRPALKELLGLVKAKSVDVVLVVKLDRLFRSLKHLVITLEEFNSLGIKFVATKDNVDYSTPAGRFFVQILGSLAEFEKSLLRERTIMGLEFAKSQGVQLGRPKTRSDQPILDLRDQGLSYTEIQERLGVSRGAIYRTLKAVSKTQPEEV